MPKTSSPGERNKSKSPKKHARVAVADNGSEKGRKGGNSSSSSKGKHGKKADDRYKKSDVSSPSHSKRNKHEQNVHPKQNKANESSPSRSKQNKKTARPSPNKPSTGQPHTRRKSLDGKKDGVIAQPKKTKKKRRDKSKKPTPWQAFKKWLFPGSMGVVDVEGQASDIAFSLGLSQRQLKKLKRGFDSVDIDGSGEIDLEEFFEFLNEPKNVFSTALFSLIDCDGSGNISFDEFISSIGTYCMFSKDDILHFIFDIFDEDGSGTLDDAEFVKMSAGVNNGDPSWIGNFRTAMENFDVNKDGLIDFGEFKMINKMFPLVMFPAFRLQDKMQKRTLGENDWVRIHNRRHAIEKLKAYMDAHLGALPPESLGARVSNFIHGRPGVRSLSITILERAKREDEKLNPPETHEDD